MLNDQLVFRDQDISIREMLELHRHYGPLHKHATTGVPREPGLEEVHGEDSRSYRPGRRLIWIHCCHLQWSTTTLLAGLILAPSLKSICGTLM